MQVIHLTMDTVEAVTATVSSTERYTGYIEKVVYDWVDATSTADLVMTANNNEVDEAILTHADIGVANIVWYPRVLANKTTDGSAFTNVAEKIYVNNATFTVTVDDALTATLNFRIVLSDE